MSNQIDLIRYRIKEHSKRCLDVEGDWPELHRLTRAAEEAGNMLVDQRRRIEKAANTLRMVREMVGHPDNLQIIDAALGDLGV